ncbi:hypothetical protein BVI434_410025 [Burkholderia vietnamiensis]|nr:hypothetical protein BVI434_410025 [Burkholderia vietnamiensis]
MPGLRTERPHRTPLAMPMATNDRIIDTTPLDVRGQPLIDALIDEYATRYDAYRPDSRAAARDELARYPADLFAPPEGAPTAVATSTSKAVRGHPRQIFRTRNTLRTIFRMRSTFLNEDGHDIGTHRVFRRRRLCAARHALVAGRAAARAGADPPGDRRARALVRRLRTLSDDARLRGADLRLSRDRRIAARAAQQAAGPHARLDRSRRRRGHRVGARHTPRTAAAGGRA